MDCRICSQILDTIINNRLHIINNFSLRQRGRVFFELLPTAWCNLEAGENYSAMSGIKTYGKAAVGIVYTFDIIFREDKRKFTSVSNTKSVKT